MSTRFMNIELQSMGAVLAFFMSMLVAGCLSNGDPGPVEPPQVDPLKSIAYRWETFSFPGWDGEPVPAVIATPVDVPPPWPCIIFLHGIGQSKADLAPVAAPFSKAGFAIASFDQYTRGERALSGAGPLAKTRGLKHRNVATVVETRRLVDHLETRPDIAADRIYLLGASYGAIVGATAAAEEPRLRAAVLTFGGGDLPILFDSPAIHAEIGFLVNLLKPCAVLYFAAADPLDDAAHIAPRPVLMQNGTRDSLVPPAAASALYDACRPPKQIIWYDSDHIGLDAAILEKVVRDAVQWLKARDREVQLSQRGE